MAVCNKLTSLTLHDMDKLIYFVKVANDEDWMCCTNFEWINVILHFTLSKKRERKRGAVNLVEKFTPSVAF